MKTAFEKIAHFNELIGNGRSMAQAEQLKVQFKMIAEEFNELEEALGVYLAKCGQVNAGDYTPEEVWDIGGFTEGVRQVRDGIADVLVTTYGLAHRLGVDADADLDAVYASNMSKFVPGSAFEAQISACEISERLGIGAVASETAPSIWAVTSARDQVGKDGKQYPKGKLLKPASYRGPVFS